MSKEMEFTDTNFKESIQKKVALVDFWAPWCAPCRVQGPIVDRVAEKFDGQAAIGKMNVDENKMTPGHFGIRAIPTLILFKDGQEVNRFTGIQQEKILVKAISNALNN
jgi:thioredoxin 1